MWQCCQSLWGDLSGTGGAVDIGEAAHGWARCVKQGSLAGLGERGQQRRSGEGAWVAGRRLSWKTSLFLQGGLFNSPVIAGFSPGFAFPAPSEGAKVSTEGGSWTWPKPLAFLCDPAASTCLLHSPWPGALHAGSLLSQPERQHEVGAVLTLLSLFNAQWWDLTKVFVGRRRRCSGSLQNPFAWTAAGGRLPSDCERFFWHRLFEAMCASRGGFSSLLA